MQQCCKLSYFCNPVANIMKFLSFLSILFITTISYGQRYGGRVMDLDNRTERLADVRIYFVDLGISVLTDSTGYWSVQNIPEGKIKIEISAHGYETQLLDVVLSPKDEFTIYLEHSHRELDEVLVSTNGKLQRESITNVSSLNLTGVNKIPTTSLGEAITNIPGVYQAGIGSGISKPVVRGLSGNRVVTYLNGLRIENQQWGADHGLPITEIGIGSVEVIKGPSSLLYGSDAMGGVIYFVDEPYTQKNAYEISAGTQLESNSLGTNNQLGFKYNKNSFRINAYANYGNYADYGLANGRYVSNSRYQQFSGKLALGYNRKKWVLNLRYNYFFARAGIPGHTHDSIPDFSTFQVATQKRNLTVPAQVVNNHFTLIENKFFGKRATWTISIGNSLNQLSEYEEKVTIPGIDMTLNSTTHNVKAKFDLTEELNLIVGTQGMIQVNSNASGAEEILIPDAFQNDLGAYALLNTRYKKWHFQLGGRYDTRFIKMTAAYKEIENFQQNYQGFNYSAGFARIAKKSTLRFNVSSGFRAPHTSELLSNGFHHGSFRYEIGRTDLKTEKAVQLDLSYAVHLADFELIVNPYYMRIQDYIYIRQTDSIIENLPVFYYDQTDFAQLYGSDFGVHYHPHKAHWLHLESSFSTIFAEDEFRNPLPLIPQTRLNTQVRFEVDMNGKFKVNNVSLQHIYFFQQNRTGILETTTPAYHLVNAGVNMQYGNKRPLYITLGARNLLNENYVNHLSFIKNIGLNAPGLNVYFSLKYKFKHKLKAE